VSPPWKVPGATPAFGGRLVILRAMYYFHFLEGDAAINPIVIRGRGGILREHLLI